MAWNVIKMSSIKKGFENLSFFFKLWNKDERKKITQEVLLLKKLNHNNIIKYINAWINEEKKEFVFITEILTGGNLKTWANFFKLS